jgi:FtsH-binding integral membrane protein
MKYYDRSSFRDTSSLSSFSSRVYGWMSIGLACTASIAYAIFATGAFRALMPFWWVWSIASFGIAMSLNFIIQRASIPLVAGLFLAYAALQGVLFGTVLPFFAAAYGGQVIWSAFATGAVIFLLATGYGYFTKSDLTALGKILSFALVGLIAISLIFWILSFFISLGFVDLLVSYLGLAIFVGLTSYDAQTIRQFSIQSQGNSTLGYKLSLMMALKMYINVIMIFWYLLRIFSSNRR